MVKKKNQSNENWVDVHNDEQMVELGIRNSLLQSRDPEVWEKTSREKNFLKKFKHSGLGHFHNSPIKFIPHWNKLIIYLKKNKKYPKTTYSTECWQHEIPFILSNYVIVRKDDTVHSVVEKYVWNGKTYSSQDLPFWGA